MLALDCNEADHGRELGRGAVGFGGVVFRLSGDAESCGRVARVAQGPLAHVAPMNAAAPANALGPKFAVSCQLELLPVRAPAEGPARITWQWSGARGELHTRFGGAALSLARDGTWLGQAWLAPEAPAAHFLLSGLCALLLHRSAGVLLHAASVVLGSGVIAFIGPSGAGKSTACAQVRGAQAFSIDRLALLPGPAEAAPVWLSHPLPGGTAPVPDIPRAAPCWLPLRGIVRVFQTNQPSAIESCSPASGVAVLRESAFQAGLGTEVEAELLAALERLGQAVPVGRLYQRLGASSEELLGRWLEDPRNGLKARER